MENHGILGHNFLEKYKFQVDYSKKIVEVQDLKFPFCTIQSGYVPRVAKVTEILDRPDCLKEEIDGRNIFRPEIGHCTNVEPCKIVTEGPPIRQKPCRQALTKRHIVEAKVEKMLEAGVIRPSESPYAFLVMLVPKKDGSTRFCVDYRRLNQVTRKDTYPLPNIQDIFDTLGGSVYFSTLDLLAAGFS